MTVLRTTTVRGAEVVTEYAGYDMRLLPSEPPRFWRTYVAGADGKLRFALWASEAAALEGHEKVCAKLRGRGGGG